MEMCTEDKDIWEDNNFKCPYCSQELISQKNLNKHLRNKHSMVIFLYNFILFNKTINYMRQFLLELHKEYCVKIKFIALD